MLFYIILGGFIGAVLRFIISQKMNKSIPIGTFFINLLGSFFLGYFFSLGISNHLYGFLGIGFCGAFTTFSTLNLEAFVLFKKNQKFASVLYILLSYIMGFYYAIRGNEEIASHSFLWFNLGHPDIAITLIAGIIYYFQFKVTQSNMPTQQQQQMKFMGLLSPIMIIVFSLNAPAALPLYWTVGGIFLIIQTMIGRKMYPTSQKEDLQLKHQS